MKLILVRHGQSIYNLENRFTGWKDVKLTSLGKEEAIKAGQILKNNFLSIDYAYTSNLKRAKDTLSIICTEMKLSIEPISDYALNERDYGDLIGQNKIEAAEKFGKEQVHQWRRSYNIPPPGGESLEMTCKRTLPYFKKILKLVLEGNNVIISAHGNSIRAIVMKLFNYTPEKILETEIGWCEPWVFEFNNDGTLKDFKILKINKKSNSNVPIFPKLHQEIKNV